MLDMVFEYSLLESIGIDRSEVGFDFLEAAFDPLGAGGTG